MSKGIIRIWGIEIDGTGTYLYGAEQLTVSYSLFQGREVESVLRTFSGTNLHSLATEVARSSFPRDVTTELDFVTISAVGTIGGTSKIAMPLEDLDVRHFRKSYFESREELVRAGVNFVPQRACEVDLSKV